MQIKENQNGHDNGHQLRKHDVDVPLLACGLIFGALAPELSLSESLEFLSARSFSDQFKPTLTSSNRFMKLLSPWQVMFILLLTVSCTITAPPTPAVPTPTFDYRFLPARATAQPVTPQPSVTAGGNTTVSYSRQIQPIFNENCVRCHGGIANLWLTSYEEMLLGALNGPVVYSGDPDNSPLYTYVRQGLMPVDTGPLEPDQIESIRRWIEEGAVKN